MVTLLDGWRSLADLIGDLTEEVTTDEASAADADARRRILCSGLASAEVGTTHYAQQWLYIYESSVADLVGQQAVVSDSGYVAASGELALTSELPAIVPTGARFAVLNRLPVKRHLTTVGLREILNTALRKMWIPDDLQISSLGRGEQDISAWGWLRRSDIVGIREPGAHGTVRMLSQRKLGIRRERGRRWLSLPEAYSRGSRFGLVVRRPAHTLYHRGGSWRDWQGVPQDGPLVYDDDATDVDLDEWLVVAQWLAYKALASSGAPSDEAPWLAREQYFGDAAARIKHRRDDELGDDELAPMQMRGPNYRGAANVPSWA